MGWLRRHYGAGPVHLLGILLCLAASAYVVTRINGQGGLIRVLFWFAFAAIAHDFILWPLYTLLDGRLIRRTRRGSGSRGSVPWTNYVRIPAVISVILLGISFPLVLRLHSAYYEQLSGLTEDQYLWNWLGISAALFVASGLIYGLRLVQTRRIRTGKRSAPP